MIQVAMLTPFFSGKLGGPYNVISEIVPHLEKCGVKTSIFTTSAITKFGRKRTEFYEKKSKLFKIYRFDSFLRFKEYRISLSMIPYLLKSAKEIDIIHSHAMRSYQEDIGALISLAKHKPFIISPHGGININWDYGDKIPKMLHDISIGYLNKKLLNPHYIAVAKLEIPILKNYGINEENIHFIPHGVNMDIFKPMESPSLKKSLGLEGFEILLYVGRIAKGKGVDKLIKILNLIRKKNKKVKLIVVGGDAGYLSQVRGLIQKYNLSDHVIFTGYIPKYNLAQYYSIASLVIYPSRQEIFGLVLCEAMACGKPVIGSDIMGPSEIIIDGKTGFTSDFKNIPELSERIVDLLDDKQYLTELGQNGLKRVKQYYTWEKTAQLHFDLYKKVLSYN
jgi:glycosyltransferase involved in cell wall biosynthesis